MNNGTILYIGGFELPDKNAAAHRVLSNAKIFRELGKKVVFIGVDKTLSPNFTIFETKKDVQGFESYSIPYPTGGKNWLKFLTSIEDYIAISKNIDNLEMVVMYNFQSVAMKKMMLYCKKNNIKCCADVTEWRSAKGEGIIYRLLKDSDTWYRMKVLHKKMDGLIVISRYLEKYYNNCRNVIYVPALVDCSEEKWTNTFEKSTGSLHLVYAGNPGRKDKIDILIQSLKKVKRMVVLDIIGISYEEFKNYFPKLEIDTDSNIKFHGRLSHLETLDYVKKANYSIFFRDDNRVSKSGFPTKFVESIASGTPVITNNTSNINEFIYGAKSNGIIIDNLDCDSIEKIIEKAPNLMNVDRGCFDYNNYLECFCDFIKNVLGGQF